MRFWEKAGHPAPLAENTSVLSLRHPMLANVIDARDQYHPVIIDHLAQSELLLRSNEALKPRETYRLIGKNVNLRFKVIWERNGFCGGEVCNAQKSACQNSSRRSISQTWAKKLSRLKLLERHT